MERGNRSTQANRLKEARFFKHVRNQKGFTYLELMISLSFLIFLIGYLLNFLLVVQKEREEQNDQLVLQHSYQMGYEYLRSRIYPAINFMGGGSTLFIEGKNVLDAFRFDGAKVIREVRRGAVGDPDGTVIAFQYVDSIQFEILPNKEGVRIVGRLKRNNQVLLFNEVIMKRTRAG